METKPKTGENMPKYKPTEQDIWSTKPCTICGCDIFFEDAETCSDFCQMKYNAWKEDFEWMMMLDFLKDENPDENMSGWE